MGSDQAWEKFGRSDAYFGVISQPAFRAAHTEGEARDAFFRSGEEHLERVLGIVREHLVPDFRPQRALDFGCGVGRVTIPIARNATEAVGVDVSPSMLAEARRNAEAAGIANSTWVRSTPGLGAVSGDFDFIHSYIVFQHIRPRRGESLLRDLLDRLRDGGVGALHFTFAKRIATWRKFVQWSRKRVPYLHNLLNLIQRRTLDYPLMEMNSYAVERLLLILEERGCHTVHLRFTDHGGYVGIFLFFRKGRLPSL